MESQKPMYRIAYVALIMSYQSGVANKMQRLAQSAQSEGIPIDYYWFTTNYKKEEKNLAPLNVENTNATNPFLVRKWQADRVNELLKTYHKVVIRYPLFDPVLMIFLKNRKRLITEHHTKETDELQITGDKRYLMEKTLGNYWLKSFGGIIAVTPEILDYELERSSFKGAHAFIPNSIPQMANSLSPNQPEGPLKMVMVANFRPWHGLDQIIEGLEKSTDQSQHFELHLVGDIPENQQSKLAKFSNVHIYGHLPYEQIEKLYRKMHLGIAGYNLGSKNMKEATALKVREYFANGLAVVIGYKDPAFPVGFPFLLETNEFNIPDILQFYNETIKTPKNIIAQSAEPWVSSKYVLRKLYDFCTK